MLVTPVLLIAFRPELTQKVFEKISEAKPKAFVAIDGPRKKNKLDYKKIQKVYKIFKNINWKCEVFF